VIRRKYIVPVVYSLGGYGDDPCSNYRKPSGADRAAGFRKLTNKSDKHSSWREDWYRFTRKAGRDCFHVSGTSVGCMELQGKKVLDVIPASTTAPQSIVIRVIYEQNFTI